MKYPTREQLNELFFLDDKSGVLTWKVRKSIRARIGSVAGYVGEHGYRIIRINGRNYRAHNIVWILLNGTIDGVIDHINHIRDDNRPENLRVVTFLENCRNQKLPVTNTSGAIGVSFYKGRGKFCARVQTNGTSIFLGYFNTVDEARKARKAADPIYGFHENNGGVI